MVNKTSEIYDFIKNTYLRSLEDKVIFLAIGGSLGRGNYVEKWSDADLLLVLSHTDSVTLRCVKSCEKEIANRFQIEVDTMITSKRTLENTPARMIHGKIKNFLFFIDKTKVLVSKDIVLPLIDYNKFVHGFWATYADQEKNYLRRNADSDLGDRKSLEKLLKKNIKIIFLLLKQRFAVKELVPCTYDEVVTLTQGQIPEEAQLKLREYMSMRKNNSIPFLTDDVLKQEIDTSLNIFSSLSEIMTRSLNNNLKKYEERN